MIRKNIAIDFDGVIHRYSKGWCNGEIYDIPTEGMKELLEAINKKYKVIIFTTRLSIEANGDKVVKQREMMIEWLKKNRFIKGKHFESMTGEKPLAEVYVDDRAYRFWSVKDLKERVL